ncbi:MAG: thiosulfate dehydrogenase [quinone] large subunit [Clostridium sp.]|jgi:thiosulfate dehydrogenase [quinone] large subunit
MDIIIKIYFIMIIFVLITIIIKLYTVIHHGKLIIKAKKSKFSAICGVVLIILLALMIIALGILGYLNYRNNVYINILRNIILIEILIFNLIGVLHSSGIRENGIYGSRKFYKWPKVQSYSWILPTTIRFEVNTFFKTNKSFEFIIKEELKSKVNETLQKYVLES